MGGGGGGGLGGVRVVGRGARMRRGGCPYLLLCEPFGNYACCAETGQNIITVVTYLVHNDRGSFFYGGHTFSRGVVLLCVGESYL